MSDDDMSDDDVELLWSLEGDEFARALDRAGWMIVPKTDDASGAGPTGRWWMSERRDDCPSWSDNGEFPRLQVIDGGLAGAPSAAEN
jgi:hypothetical protein